MGWLDTIGNGIETGLGETWNFLRGDPNSVKAAYDQAMGKANEYGQQSKDFLMGQQQKALQYYAPLQQMFGNAYGTQGIAAPQIPGVPSPGPLQQTFGGRR